MQLSKKIPPEVMTSISSIDEPGRLVDTIANHMTLQLQEKQNLLELVSLQARIEHLMALIESEIDLFQVENVFAVALRSRWRRVSASTI